MALRGCAARRATVVCRTKTAAATAVSSVVYADAANEQCSATRSPNDTSVGAHTTDDLLRACTCHRRQRLDAPTQVLREHARRCPARALMLKCDSGRRQVLMARCTILVCAYCRQHGHVKATCKRRQRQQRRQETELFAQGNAEGSRD